MANWITFLRVLLAIFALLIIKINPLFNLIGVSLIIISMLLDALDGFMARKLQIFTFKGSIYDILADRIIENVFFLFFATMALFNVWIAVTILIRGLTIDAIRTLFAINGNTAFGDSTFHQYRWTKVFTCSKLSRGIYNTSKIITFISFAFLLEPNAYIFNIINMSKMQLIAHFSLWVTVVIAAARAIPVFFEGIMHQSSFS